MCEKNILKIVAMICITIVAVVIAIKGDIHMAVVVEILGTGIIIPDWQEIL